MGNSEFFIIGHKGAPFKQPENTISSFEEALREGANALELDLCFTQDNHIVVWHDWDPNSLITSVRRAGWEGGLYKPATTLDADTIEKPVNKLSLNYLKANYYLKGNGKRVEMITFKEFVYWVKKYKTRFATDAINPLKHFFFDIKIPEEEEKLTIPFLNSFFSLTNGIIQDDQICLMNTSEQVVRTMINYTNTINSRVHITWDKEITRFMAQSGHHSAFRRFSQGQEMQKRCDYSSIGKPVFPCAIGFKPWSMYKEQIRQDIKQKPDSIKKYICWTINSPQELSELYSLGADGIITDDPFVLSEIVRGKKPQPYAKIISAVLMRENGKLELWIKTSIPTTVYFALFDYATKDDICVKHVLGIDALWPNTSVDENALVYTKIGGDEKKIYNYVHVLEGEVMVHVSIPFLELLKEEDNVYEIRCFLKCSGSMNEFQQIWEKLKKYTEKYRPQSAQAKNFLADANMHYRLPRDPNWQNWNDLDETTFVTPEMLIFHKED